MEDALANFQRGCLMASEAALKQDNLLRNEEGASLYEKILSIRTAAMSPPEDCLTFSSAALRKVSARLTVEIMKGKRSDMSREEAISNLTSFNEETTQTFLSKQGYTPLYIETWNCRAEIDIAIGKLFCLENDREGAWRAIRDIHRKCPFVAMWIQNVELNDATCIPPTIVKLARVACQPRVSKSDDQKAASALRRSLSTADPADVPTLRWWAMYMSIDAEEWDFARELCHDILMDCAGGQWPPHYLPEVLYYAALIEFVVDSHCTCKQFLDGYFDLAHVHDRHRADAILMRLWAEQSFPPHPPTLQLLCRRKLETKGLNESWKEEYPDLLSLNKIENIIYYELPCLRESLERVWDEETFSHFTWARIQIAEQLGIEETNPFVPIAEHLKQDWKSLRNWGNRPPYFDDFVESMVQAGGRTIEIRFRMENKP